MRQVRAPSLRSARHAAAPRHAGRGRTSRGRLLLAWLPGGLIVVLKLSLNWDQAMSPQGRMSPLKGSPGSCLLPVSHAWGLQTALALSPRASCLSFLLRTYLGQHSSVGAWRR